MTVTVEFPDGSWRDVPGQLTERRDRVPANGRACYVQIPINSDPNWQYMEFKNHWIARPRRPMRPTVQLARA